MTTPKPPRAPKGLKARGKALFREITSIYVLDPGELVLLRELCRTVDRIDTIDHELARDGLTVVGSRGQLPRAHPLLYALAEAQKAVSRLVAELALPLPGEQVGRRRSPQQKAAAHSRWTREARLQDVSHG
ncbi:P27 family phage terminase small subunit [Mycobacterium kyorinense]|uniref:P27 family phage terminase small subunit n=1 Tax=Mycobacterium kyorinense TaxID=487514 RepID=UPI0018D378B6|nr:P27 family phage terminase small subunit [Mycobacterium kyorinense]